MPLHIEMKNDKNVEFINCMCPCAYVNISHLVVLAPIESPNQSGNYNVFQEGCDLHGMCAFEFRKDGGIESSL